MILYSNGCSHTAVKENAAAHIFFDSLWMTKRYHEIGVSDFYCNRIRMEEGAKFEDSKNDWKKIKSALENKGALHFHHADHGKNNQRIFIETIDFVSRLINENKKPDFCIIQWSGPNRKLDFNYESTYTYDYSEYNDTFTHSVNVNPHDYSDKGLLVEPFASKTTLQYMFMLQNFFVSYDIEYAFIPYMELQKDEFLQAEYNLLDKSKFTTNPFIGHRNNFRKRNLVTDFNGHPNLIAGNYLTEKLYEIFNLGEYDFSMSNGEESTDKVEKFGRVFTWYKTTDKKIQRDIILHGNELEDGEDSVINKVVKKLL